MKSYLFTTENGRGGVILCDIDTFEEAVEYLQQRFDGVIRVEQGRTLWTLESGFGEFVPTVRVDSPPQAPPDENAQAAQAQTPELF
ncbi:hypothetical protein [Marinobacterium aestuariivivens]|uniref:DUF1737 domain-containing protein n=1 Tax=Marinobacterium aestuariivivens TaxID=1698799 RepID=A0ABW1ZVI1_9GAMM